MADIRTRNQYKPLPLTGTITLHCFECGRQRMLTPLEQKDILATLKRSTDVYFIECACGQVQFVLRERFVVSKKEQL